MSGHHVALVQLFSHCAPSSKHLLPQHLTKLHALTTCRINTDIQ